MHKILLGIRPPALCCLLPIFVGLTFAAACVGVFAPKLGQGAHGLATNHVGQEDGHLPLQMIPEHIYLGVLRPGERGSGKLMLRNPTTSLVRVCRIVTGCPCVKVAPDRTEIVPGESRSVDVSFEPSSDPDFRGGLSVDLTGYAWAGEVVFRAQVDFDVAERESKER